MKKILQNRISLKLLSKEINTTWGICSFCHKQTKFSSNNERLSGKTKFFCAFCIQHNYHTKNNNNVLILSFRGILGYLYEENYLNERKIWASQIIDYVNMHQKIGLENPLFSYDPETMYWFIDFLKVGESKKRIPLKEVLKTIINILSCFNLSEIHNLNLFKLYSKYKEIVENFYICKKNNLKHVPTLENCGIPGKNFENTQEFTLSTLTESL